MKQMKQKFYRQGDVLLQRITKNQVPASIKPVPPKNGRVILAYGEATGHHHSTDADLSQQWVDEAGVTFLEAKEAIALLHQEHDEISLAKGWYRNIPQRRYHRQEIRRVID